MSKFDGMGNASEIAKKHGDTFESGKVDKIKSDMSALNQALDDKEAGEELIRTIEAFDGGPDERKHKHEIEQLITAMLSGDASSRIFLMLPGGMDFIVSTIVLSWRAGYYSAVKDRR